MIDWEPISNSLKEIYKSQNILVNFKEDEQYLKYSFEFVEQLWQEQLINMQTIKVIMISEAPLFGSKEKYIYNINTAPSSFFYFNDLEAMPTYNIFTKKPKSKMKQKQIMIKEFNKNGFLILDIFPFALNQVDTKINYRKMSVQLYQQLLKSTTENYLIPKLELCLQKSTKDTSFIYRYKRLFRKTSNHFENILKKVSDDMEYRIDTVNGSNMSLDRKKLENLLNNKIIY